MNASYKRSVFTNAAKVAHLTYQIGETDILRKKSDVVDVNKIKSAKIRSVISKLSSTLLEFRQLTGKGKGIAAVQIGIPLQIAVIFLKKDLLTIINPKVINRSKTLLIHPEICMSANPIIAQVTRPEWSEFSYLDELGNTKVWKDKKNRILNRVFQHEIDHMNGIININLVASKDLILDSDPRFFKRAKFIEIQ